MRLRLSLCFYLMLLMPLSHAALVTAPGVLPMKVYISFYIADIASVNTAEESFDTRIFIRYRWKDERLAHDGRHAMTKPLSEIWHPNIQIINQQRVLDSSTDQASISPDGTVIYRSGIWGRFSQALSLAEFPFDHQKFTFQLVAVGFSPQHVTLVGETEQEGKLAFAIAPKLSLSDWSVGETYYESASFQPVPNVDLSLAAISYTFEAERLTTYYIVKMILPLILIVIMSWAVFWMDPLNVASNVGISMTSMLTLIAYRFSADTILPRLSYLTSLDYFILASTILVFLSLAQNLMTSSLAKSGNMAASRRLDIICRGAFPVFFVIIIFESLVFRFLL